jgi:uncharacterized membrane protein
MQFHLFVEAPLAVQLHAFGAVFALTLGTAQMFLPKGHTAHIIMGWLWVAIMVMVAGSAFFIRNGAQGSLGPLHLFIPLTVFGLFGGLMGLYRKDARRHGRSMRGLYTGGLVLAGLIAFMPGRLMWQVVFGA